jgi:hypothetical protein
MCGVFHCVIFNVNVSECGNSPCKQITRIIQCNGSEDACIPVEHRGATSCNRTGSFPNPANASRSIANRAYPSLLRRVEFGQRTPQNSSRTRGIRVINASVNWMTTLISSSVLSRALAKFSGCSLLVISRFNHERSVLANASPALYQRRLLALTLPTTALFLRITSAAISPAVSAPVLRSPLSMPVRQMTPPLQLPVPSRI